MARHQSSLLSWSQYLALRGFVGIFRHIDPNRSRRFMNRLGSCIFHRNNRRKLRTLNHIRLSFPDWSDEHIAEVAEKSMQYAVRMVMVDALVMPALITPANWPRYIKHQNIQEIYQSLSNSRPVIYVTGHCGNWEMLAYSLSLTGFPFTALARPLDNPLINDWLLATRQAWGMNILTKWNAMPVLRTILARGGKIGFVADQNAGRRGIFVPFFGRLASCYKTMGLLAMRYEASIYSCFAQARGDTLQYQVESPDILEPAEWEDHPYPLFFISAWISRSIENMVRTSPEQYLWLHRRWKSRPKHELKGRQIPGSLIKKLESLPWMTQEEMDRIIETTNNPDAYGLGLQPT